MIKLKFGTLVTEPGHPSFVSNEVLGKIFGVSGNKIRQLYIARFSKISDKRRPLLEQLRIAKAAA